jgi:hypothetical protein
MLVSPVGAYTLPKHVAAVVTTIFGLHGLPLPARQFRQSAAETVAVTPAVIAQAYSVGNVAIDRNGELY